MTERARPKKGAGKGAHRTHLADFRPQQRNANRHTPRGLGMLDAAISEDGYVAPMTATADGEIIDGSARLERVAERLRDVDPLVIEHDGTRPIIAIRTDIPHANTPQAKRIALRANRIAQVDLDWDVDLLASLNAEVPDLTKGLWSDEELAALFDAQPAHDVDALEDIPGPTTPYVLAGDEWQLGSHRLCVADSRGDPTRMLRTDRPRLMIFDPPFDLDYLQWTLPQTIDVCMIWGRGRKRLTFEHERMPREYGVHELILHGGVRGQHNHTLPCCVHDVIHFWRRTWWTKKQDAIDRTVIRACGCTHTEDDRPMSVQEHAGGVRTELMIWGKPVKAMAIAMAYVTHGSMVWDPCAGSGSSLIAAEVHGRRWIGAESNLEWAQMIVERWVKVTGKPEVVACCRNGERIALSQAQARAVASPPAPPTATASRPTSARRGRAPRSSVSARPTA